ncbi:MAG: VTT domain-containing protein [Chloroflexi bacterium]|nr:VTT domain-containing protein [Chloroflexota bacterium]
MSKPEIPDSLKDTDSVAPLSTPTLIISGAGFLGLLTLLYGFVNAVGIDELQLMIADAGFWGPLVFVSIKALTFTFAPLSAGPIQFASGILFGVIPGTLYSVLGEVIGGAINVLIARLLGRRIVRRFVGAEALQRIDRFYERYLDDWKSLLAARLLLFSVYDFISYAVGFGHIRLSVYIAVSFIGGLIPTYIFVLVGSQAAQSQDVLLLFYVGAALVFAVYLLFRRQISRLVARVKNSL